MLKEVQVALVTGASSGIGEAFARQLALLGKDLILVARSKDKLDALAEELAAEHGGQVRVIVVDLSLSDSAIAVFAETERQGLVVDLLVNNAGFGKVGEFTTLSFEDQANMVRLNVNTLMELTHLYLPGLRQRRRGGVINVGSTASFQPLPKMAVYGATKAFVLSFSEAVAEEVSTDNVTVMALCPGFTATGFQARAGGWLEKRDAMPTASEVVTQALRAFERRQVVFLHGGLNRIRAFLARLGPRWVVRYFAARVVDWELL